MKMLDCIGAAYVRADEVLNAFWDRRFREQTEAEPDQMVGLDGMTRRKRRVDLAGDGSLWS